MKKPEQILSELKENNWIEYSHDPFVDEVLFKATSEQINEQETMVSQVWGIRLDDQNKLTSTYELLTLTSEHIISVYSDLNNENDKVHIYLQPINKIDKFNVDKLENENNYLKIDIQINGIKSSIASNDDITVDHFNEQIQKDLAEIKKTTGVHKTERQTEFLEDDLSTEQGLKTVQANEFIQKSKQSTKQWTKKNLELMKKYANNNILWYSIIVFVSLFQVALSASYLIIINDGSPLETMNQIYHSHRASLITGSVFSLLFSCLSITAFIALTMKIWDKHKFSKELYRILLELVLSIIIMLFSILMMARLDLTAYTSALYMLPITLLLTIDGSYFLIESYIKSKKLNQQLK